MTSDQEVKWIRICSRSTKASTSMRFVPTEMKPHELNQDFPDYPFTFFPPQLNFVKSWAAFPRQLHPNVMSQVSVKKIKWYLTSPWSLGISTARMGMGRDGAGIICWRNKCVIYCMSPRVSRSTWRSAGQHPASNKGDSLCRGCGPGMKPSRESSLHGVLLEGTPNSK